jgi:asparagine synthase (glutamine-hydrolysing)
MLNNFRNLQSLFWSHGSRWLLFRVGYALRKRTGMLRMQMPQYPWDDRPLETWLKHGIPSTPKLYAEWREQNQPKFFFGSFRAEQTLSGRHAPPLGQVHRDAVSVEHLPGDIPWNPRTAVKEAEKILAGTFRYFSHTDYQIGFPPDWHKDPVTGWKLASQKHWSELSDDAEVDIKFVWEASRFGMVYPLVRAYGSTREEKYAQAFWRLIQSWAESNPPNTGPNWMDGQEAALRLMAWMFGYYRFFDSASAAPERIAMFTVLVAVHAHRIYKNIDYAISTHSNHTVSEAFGLWLVGLLFPELKDSEKYLTIGRKLLEQEAAAQIFPDGTYSMYSLNYHRFILHIYLCVFRLAELNHSPINGLIFERVSASIDYLSQIMDPETGKMPVYGSNDGALVLPLNNCDFTDYRPLLQLGAYIIRKQFLFEPGPWDEDIFWLYGEQSLSRARQRLSHREGLVEAGVRVRKKSHSSFSHGGTFILRGPNSQAIIRCTDYRSGPSHADQLHVDLWIRGQNIACDAGTYLYTGEGIWRNGLAHTAVHNTVTVDRQDQMNMLTRFTWTHWSHGKVLRHDEHIWQGEHDGYERLPDPVHHKRTLLALAEDRWLVVDHLSATGSHHYALQWLLPDFPFVRDGNSVVLSLEPLNCKVRFGLLEGKSSVSIVRADPNSTRGWRSQYYGEKEPAISILLETDRSNACFWSYFGGAEDALEVKGKTLKINSQDIDLEELDQ